MKICPNCLISVCKEKHFCHQCGSGIDISLANKSQKISSKRRLSKSELMHKFKFLKLDKNKQIHWFCTPNPARNGGVFYLIFKMFSGYVKSNFAWQNCRLWQAIWTKILTFPTTTLWYFPLTIWLFLDKYKNLPHR